MSSRATAPRTRTSSHGRQPVGCKKLVAPLRRDVNRTTETVATLNTTFAREHATDARLGSGGTRDSARWAAWRDRSDLVSIRSIEGNPHPCDPDLCPERTSPFRRSSAPTSETQGRTASSRGHRAMVQACAGAESGHHHLSTLRREFPCKRRLHPRHSRAPGQRLFQKRRGHRKTAVADAVPAKTRTLRCRRDVDLSGNRAAESSKARRLTSISLP